MPELHDHVLVSLRRIIRATDLYSRKLGKETGLTAPQLVVMRAIRSAGNLTVSGIANKVSLSQATVTSILNRLETHGLVKRQRGKQDKRQVFARLTGKGNRLFDMAPPALQEDFSNRFARLADWEQHLIVAAMARVAALMEADNIDAAPVLWTGDDIN